MKESFTVYKGLQKPLVFKGMKGRFITLTLGLAMSVFILGVIIYLLFGGVVALIFVGVYGSIGGVYLAMEQKKGLYPKKKDKKKILIKRIL